jgi:hypothetical protein
LGHPGGWPGVFGVAGVPGSEPSRETAGRSPPFIRCARRRLLMDALVSPYAKTEVQSVTIDVTSPAERQGE